MLASDLQKGLAAGLFCFIFWGFGPIYFKFIQEVPALVIIAHRLIWGILFLAIFLAFREGKLLIKTLTISPKLLFGLFISGTLVASNWLLFVWAVNHDQILSTSLGYFINPLVNILFGTVFLNEQMNTEQKWAVGIAGAGTLFLGIYLGQPPWIALLLALTFGLYGLVKKQLKVKPMIGLFWETLLLVLPAIIYLLYYAPAYDSTPDIGSQEVLLFFSGLITILPLIGFNYATKKLPLTLIGFLQYIAPSISFTIAVLFYGEEFTVGHQVAFLSIWSALLIVSWRPFHQFMRQK